MSDDGTIAGATAGTIAGIHAQRHPLRVLAAPALAAEFNLVQSAIFPIACFRVDDLRFDFGSSVVLPELKAELPLLAKLIAGNTQPAANSQAKPKIPPATVFGHADPVGNDEFNKSLSGRRAAAIYGMLTRRTEVWEDLYSNGGKFASTAAGDNWGTRAVQIMLNEVVAPPPAPPAGDSTNGPAPSPASGDPTPAPQSGGPTSSATSISTAAPTSSVAPDASSAAPDASSGSADDFTPIPTDGQMSDQTKDAVRKFQSGPDGKAAGLGMDGNPGPATRKALFLAYMNRLCVDEAGKPFTVDPTEGFLGHHADDAGKADFQGCGEFNPVLLFSQDDKQTFDAAEDKSARNTANATNRRVVIMLFRPGAKVSASYWPCPRAKEPTAGCRKRFWSDAETRRANGPEQREFRLTRDTFACRFFDRLSVGSPCDGISRDDLTKIDLLLRSNSGGVPIQRRKYQITVNDNFILKGTTNDDGLVFHPHVPPGDYPLKLDGFDEETLVPTTPVDAPSRETRVPGLLLSDGDDDNPDPGGFNGADFDPDSRAQAVLDRLALFGDDNSDAEVT